MEIVSYRSRATNYYKSKKGITSVIGVEFSGKKAIFYVVVAICTRNYKK